MSRTELAQVMPWRKRVPLEQLRRTSDVYKRQALRHGLADGLRFRDFYIPPTEGKPRIYVVKDVYKRQLLKTL